jgi:hypothetical protein
MTPLVITLILIGAGIIILSCFLLDKSDGNGLNNKSVEQIQEMTAMQMQDMKRSLNSFASDVMNDTFESAEDQLSQLANNKIIAVDEFSNQILAKISHNHEEVVFLYNMLNEKESQLKDLIKQVDETKKQLKKSENSNNDISSEDTIMKDNSQNNPLAGNKLKNNKKIDNLAKANKTNENKINLLSEEDNIDDKSNNRKILELYSQGHSILEISKMLGLGQGEIKLVIDLFKE